MVSFTVLRCPYKLRILTDTSHIRFDAQTFSFSPVPFDTSTVTSGSFFSFWDRNAPRASFATFLPEH